MYRVFIGYDPNEVEAFHVLSNSIIRHASAPVSITPVKRDQLPYGNEQKENESTQFSMTRFLVPWMANYHGPALFMDCDMMVTQDIVGLFQQYNERYAVQVIKHDYEPTTTTKFLGRMQTKYPRKNWSSVMLFNADRCTVLTPSIVNGDSVDGLMTGGYLHQFCWVSDEEIGELTPEWNFLVGEYEWNLPTPPANIHWTLGGPWFEETKDCEFSDLYNAEKELMK